MKENISIAIALIVTLSLLLGFSIGQNYHLYKKVQQLSSETYHQNIVKIERLPHAERELDRAARELDRARIKLESKLIKSGFKQEKEVLKWKLKNCDRISLEQAVELSTLEEVFPTTTTTYTTE